MKVTRGKKENRAEKKPSCRKIASRMPEWRSIWTMMLGESALLVLIAR
jgi:hypothetical protein